MGMLKTCNRGAIRQWLSFLGKSKSRVWKPGSARTGKAVTSLQHFQTRFFFGEVHNARQDQIGWHI